MKRRAIRCTCKLLYGCGLYPNWDLKWQNHLIEQCTIAHICKHTSNLWKKLIALRFQKSIEHFTFSRQFKLSYLHVSIPLHLHTVSLPPYSHFPFTHTQFHHFANTTPTPSAKNRHFHFGLTNSGSHIHLTII